VAKIDKTKEFIGFLKSIFLTLIALDASLIAFLYNNGIEKNILVFVLVIVISVSIIVLFFKILKEISKLEEM